MRPLLAALLLALPAFSQTPASVSTLHWIAGQWAGATSRATFEEQWFPPVGGAMVGMSRTLAGGRMVAFEYLRIVEKEGGIFYVAQPNGRPPTEFRMTSQTADRVVFENPQHDHPKIITYEKDPQGNVVATIEGQVGDQIRRQQFRFERVAPSTPKPVAK